MRTASQMFSHRGGRTGGFVVRLASRVSQIRPFHVMALLQRAQALAAAGRDVIHLEVGQPDFAAAPPVLAAADAALQSDALGYTPALGLPALRAAIATYYEQHLGVAVDAAQVIVTPGASGAIALATALLFETGDQVLVTDPGYPCNEHLLRWVGAQPQRVVVGPEQRFQLDAELVAAHWQPQTRGVWLALPSNPTGTTLSLAAVAAIHAEVNRREGVLLIDEIYQGLLDPIGAQRTPATVLALPDPAGNRFVFNSFSKFFNMTGWRLGWMVVPPGLVEPLERLAQNLYLAPPTPAQHAALAALSSESLAVYEARRDELRARRQRLQDELPKLGFRIPCVPDGGFYLYCDVTAICDDSFAFCMTLLEETGVALTPGLDFGHVDAERYLRIACTAPMPRLLEALDRIRSYLN